MPQSVIRVTKISPISDSRVLAKILGDRPARTMTPPPKELIPKRRARHEQDTNN